MEMNLLDRILDQYQKEQAPVTITLQNKVRVHGKIKAFDSYVIMMENQKHEIVYRHCISCLSRYAQEAVKEAPVPRPASLRTAPKSSKPSVQRSHQAQPSAKISAAAGDSNLNSGMKEGLLKWMQKQKAAK